MDYKKLSASGYSWQRSGWGSSDSQINRHMLIHQKLTETRIFKSILDFGCNDCFFFQNYLYLYSDVEKAVGFDICKETLEKSIFNDDSSVELEHNLKNLKIKYKEYFDIVICCGVLQIKNINPSQTIKDIYELLNVGGIIILSTLSLDWEGFRNPDNIPNYKNKWFYFSEIKSLMNENFFDIKSVTTLNPRTGNVGKLGVGYDIIVKAQKLK